MNPERWPRPLSPPLPPRHKKRPRPLFLIRMEFLTFRSCNKRRIGGGGGRGGGEDEASDRQSVRGAPSQSHTNKSAAQEGRMDGRQERPLKEPKERGREKDRRRAREGAAVRWTNASREGERGYLSKISQRLTASSIPSSAAGERLFRARESSTGV